MAELVDWANLGTSLATLNEVSSLRQQIAAAHSRADGDSQILGWIAEKFGVIQNLLRQERVLAAVIASVELLQTIESLTSEGTLNLGGEAKLRLLEVRERLDIALNQVFQVKASHDLLQSQMADLLRQFLGVKGAILSQVGSDTEKKLRLLPVSGLDAYRDGRDFSRVLNKADEGRLQNARRLGEAVRVCIDPDTAPILGKNAVAWRQLALRVPESPRAATELREFLEVIRDQEARLRAALQVCQEKRANFPIIAGALVVAAGIAFVAAVIYFSMY